MDTPWRVAVDAPLYSALTYLSSTEFEPQRGQKVTVPLGRRKASGVLLGPESKQSAMTLRSIESLDAELPSLPEAHLQWLEWLAQYYYYPIGSVVHLAYPPLKKKSPRKSSRPPVIPQLAQESPLALTPEQAQCFESIRQHLKGFSTHLIYGVTGSGKTEVYLQILQEVLESGKSGLVLVPEISLTPQLIQRFAKRFGNQIAALHSQLTDRERTNQWWEVNEGKKKILIGARSALFCPIPNLGMIIVDEEHEPSFKQDEKLKYHGRDAAIMLAKAHQCPILLGSATPSLESWKNAQDGKYQLHRLKNRVEDRALPNIEIIDLRKSKGEEKPKHIPFWLSEQLYQRMIENLESQNQVALFLNRRGMAQVVLCPSCGYSYECPNCDINLTLHGSSHLICHYCDYHENLKSTCPDCREGEIKASGLGTELVEQDLRKLFPDKKIARADRDEIQSRLEMEQLISDMESGEIDILIGTQMIAKGLDFPKLKLVGLLLADVGFNFPDFRATERSFQLITQMSGRSGRHIKKGESPGEVIIQTYNTEHDSLLFAQKHDFEGFAEKELMHRTQLHYPPIGKLLSFRIQGTQLDKVQLTCQRLLKRAQHLKQKFTPYLGLEILGPAQAPLTKLRGQFRYHFLVKASQAQTLNAFARQILSDPSWIEGGTRILIDVDPIHLL